MKRIFSAVTAAALLLSLCACSFGSVGIKEPVTFYFPRQMDTEESFSNAVENGVLGSEIREASGHTEDLRYLIALHLQGPLDTGLVSPFPANTALLSVQAEETALIITLNAAFTELKDMDLTLACTSLARTCFGLCEAESVQILAYAESNNVDVTISRGSLLLSDDSYLAEAPTDSPQ